MSADPLVRVTRAARAKRKAEAEYAAAVMAAVEALDPEVNTSPGRAVHGVYSIVAAAAGCSRQSVRSLVRTRRK